VTLIRGDLIHDTGTRQRVVYESEEPITGVELQVDEKFTTLFIATTARILKVNILGKGKGQPPKTVEDSGCGVGCMTVDKRTGDIVVARDDAIYYYTLEGRGPPRAYEAPKKAISAYKDYVALVSPPPDAPGGEDAVRRRFGAPTTDAIFNTSTFSLLETDLKIVAHAEALLSPANAVFQIWGDLYTLTQDGKVVPARRRPVGPC